MSNDLKERLPAAGGAPGTSVAKTDKPPSLAQVVRSMIDTQAVAFKQVLPGTVDPERFSRLVLSAVKAAPDLMKAFGTQQGQTSVLLAAMQCAALGLEPNTPTQDAWLLPRKNSGVHECQLMIGYRGLLKLARRSGTVKSVRADVVRERDEFHWEYGLDEDVLKHVPYTGDEDPGKLVYAYAVARFTNGGSQFLVMNRRDVEKRRAMSSSAGSAYSPWNKWEEEMWKKTALRGLIPYLELRTEEAAGIERDERRLHVNDDGVIDVADDDMFGELAAGSPAGEDPEAAKTSEKQQEADANDDAAMPSVPPAAESSPAGSPPEFVAMTESQNKAIHALLKTKYGATGDDRFPILNLLLDREDITSTKELSKDDAGVLIDKMQQVADHQSELGQ